MADKEGELIEGATDFVAQLNTSHEEMLGELRDFHSSIGDHSQTLSRGVSQVLQEGQSTCKALSEAVDHALAVLVGDAEGVRGSMTGEWGAQPIHALCTPYKTPYKTPYTTPYTTPYITPHIPHPIPHPITHPITPITHPITPITHPITPITHPITSYRQVWSSERDHGEGR
jgi:hypothetical protein